MKKLTAIILATLCVLCATAQDDKPVWSLEIGRVTVTGERPLSAIGVQKTTLDSAALRDNIASSLADVLTLNSSIFIKSYGRATLSTASFRGTAPSHTVVTWNGMNVNSPMLGMVDFSLIPSYFIDDASIYHGASSVGVGGGGLGGAITLSTRPTLNKGFEARYIQGVGSYDTYDQFLRLGWGDDRWRFSTRAYYAQSDNDFKYTNYNKWDFTYDHEGNIIDRRRPTERNRNGSFKDLHILQEVHLSQGSSRWSLSAWYMDSRRGIPTLNVSYREQDRSRNRQNETTLRTALTWERHTNDLALSAKAGYTYTDLQYHELSDNGGILTVTTNSQNYIHTISASADGEKRLGDKWIIAAGISARQHMVRNADHAIVTQGSQRDTIGYDQARFEISALASVRWRPTGRLGLALNVREELSGDRFSQPIPALFAEYLLTGDGALVAKASASRNYRFPTLNDMYFVPGGNPNLDPERGFTYDLGVEGTWPGDIFDLSAEATAYDSHIDDWILWLPMSNKGLWTPLNIKKVHSYGLEIKSKFNARLGKGWNLSVQGNYSLTKSLNKGAPLSPADVSAGKQLAYVPVHSGALVGRVSWQGWELAYKWSAYSERFATSSNERGSKLWSVPAYYMSDISLEKRIAARWAGISLKIAVNNLFGEEYESVLSRPMAGRNFGFFLEITPRFRNN